MTREEQLDWLYRLRSEIYVYMPKEWLIPMNNALDMTIKALEQEPCDKYIKEIDHLRKYISKLETQIIEQEPKAGRWISTSIQGEVDGQIIKAFVCSECGAISVFRMTDGKIVNGDLCPNCGAKMESEDIKNE